MAANRKVLIFGSCVTRDIFRIYPAGIDIVDYYARCSLVSLNSPPCQYCPEEISLLSPFQKRMVERDLSKDFYTRLSQRDFDYLLVDFIDERFNLMYNGETFITKSNELVKSGFIDNKEGRFQEVDRTSLAPGIWEKACDCFIHQATANIEPRRIILIRALWAEKYRTQAGTINNFKQIAWITANNQRLEAYYEYFYSKCAGCHLLCENDIAGDEAHRWGLSPFHYTPEWYANIHTKLDLIMGTEGSEENNEQDRSL